MQLKLLGLQLLTDSATKEKIFHRMCKVKKKKDLSFSWWKTKGSLHNYDSVFSACKVLFFCRIGLLIFDESLRTLHDINTEWWGSVQRLVQTFLKKSHIKESSFPDLCFKFIDT